MVERTLTWFISAFVFVFLSQAQAKLPFNAFKNVSQHFSNVYYSPVLGMSALESGIITAIRFAFVNNEVVNKINGLRIFQADQITNPHGNIAKILFPSVTGELGIDTNAQVTISSHATPEFMARIMVVTSKIRRLVQTQQEEQLNRFLNTIWEDYFFKASGSGKKQTTSGILAKVSMTTTDRNKLKTQITQLFRYIGQAINEEEQRVSLLPKYTVEQLISAFICTKLNSSDELQDYLTSLYAQDYQRLIFRDLSHQVAASLKELFADITLFDRNDEAFYMEVLKANLHETLEPPPISSSAASSGSAVSSSGSSALAASAIIFDANPKILDSIYALIAMTYFYNPTPYINAAPSHGPAGFVEGVEALINHERGTFSDCNENSLRVLLNLMSFDASRRQFNLAFLEKARGPRVEILKEFFNKYQTVTNIGSTSLTVRTQWNRVVGDLNSFLSIEGETTSSSSSSSSAAASSSSNQDVTPSIARVRYLRGNNELDSGFANVLRVFEKVLGISLLPSFPETGSIEEKKKPIQQGFVALFKFIAPGSQVEIIFNNLQSKTGDLTGYMTVTVDNQFQFTLYEGNETHGHIENIKSLVPQSSSDQAQLNLLRYYENLLQNETFATLLLLQQYRPKPINNRFYYLFSKPIYGNREAIVFLEKLAQLPDDGRFNLPLKFVLKQIAWDDIDSIQIISQNLITLLDREEYRQTIFADIGYFTVSEKYPIEFVEKNMKNLMFIDFSDESYVNIQNVMPNIKGISLPAGATAIPDLRKLPNIEILNLYNSQINSLEFPQPMPYLKYLSLPQTFSDWSQLQGIENLIALEEWYLSHTQISSIEFKQLMPKVKTLWLPGTITDWSHVKGIEYLPALDWLDLGATKITTLEFPQPMLNLDELSLPVTLTSVKGIENLTALKKLDLKSTKISTLELTQPMPNLKTILFPRTLQSCILYGKQEDWHIKQLDIYGRCQAEADKHTVCLHDPKAVILVFTGDDEGSSSSSAPPN